MHASALGYECKTQLFKCIVLDDCWRFIVHISTYKQYIKYWLNIERMSDDRYVTMLYHVEILCRSWSNLLG